MKRYIPILLALIMGYSVLEAKNTRNRELRRAVTAGNQIKVMVLLASGANVDAQDQDENTPLILATKKGNASIVTQLLANDADPRMTNKFDETALDIALSSLEDANATLEEARESAAETKIFKLEAIIKNYEEIIANILRYSPEGALKELNLKKIIKTSIDFTTSTSSSSVFKELDVDKNFDSAAAEYCSESDATTTENTLSEGSFDNSPIPDRNGNLPLHVAAQTGDLNLVYELLTNGADVNAPNLSEEATALHLAAQSGHFEIVKLLLTQPGIDPSLTDKYGRSARYLAYEKGYRDIAALILGPVSENPYHKKNAANREKIRKSFLAGANC